MTDHEQPTIADRRARFAELSELIGQSVNHVSNPSDAAQWVLERTEHQGLFLSVLSTTIFQLVGRDPQAWASSMQATITQALDHGIAEQEER